MVLATALALAFLLLALTAAEALAGSSYEDPPKTVLMKYKTVLQTSYAGGGQWNYQGGFVIIDSFGSFAFPKADEVAASRRLHIRFAKPEQPNFAQVNAWPDAKRSKGYGGFTPSATGRSSSAP